MVNSRRLFGRGAEAMAGGLEGATGSGMLPPIMADETPPLGLDFGLGAAGGAGALAAGTLALESNDLAVEGALGEQLPVLGERMAQLINTRPERAAGASRSGEMPIDEIMRALLSDPQSATALTSFVQPAPPPQLAPARNGRGLGDSPQKSPAHHGSAAASPSGVGRKRAPSTPGGPEGRPADRTPRT